MSVMPSQPLSRRVFSLAVAFPVLLLEACGPGEVSSAATSTPVITTQPASVTSSGITSTVFKVLANGGALTYQWYKDGTLVSGATQPSYTTTAAGSYTVVVSNTLGKVTSIAAVLTISVDPVIAVQPASATITAGKSTVLTVVATGTGLSYQWYRNSAVLTGATGTSYTASAADTYYVTVVSSLSGSKTITSATATVTVNATAIAPVISVQPVSAQVVAGNTASFAVTATGTDLTYQWYKDSVAIAGATSTSYALATPTTSNAGKYYVVVTNSIGFAASTVAVLTVVAVNSGSNTSLVVNAANAFLATLNTGQQTVANSSLSASTVLFANTLSNARTWTDMVGTRHGLRLNSATLSVAQLNAADALIAAALSSTGALLMSEIRLSDDAFAALNFNSGGSSGLYSIAFIGQPSTTQLWTLQLTGHQLTYNITYNTPLPSATPMFIGAQPPNWTYSSGGQYTVNGSGTSSGTPHAPMETQRVAVSSLASALVADSAVVSVAKLLTTRTDLLMGPTSAGDTRYRAVGYPTGTSGRGILASKLSTAQQAAVQAVIQAWVNTQATDVAQTLLDAYLASDAFAATYVAYAPGTGGSADFEGYPNAKSLPGSANNSYLRIDGPRVWIEFIVASMDNTLAGYVHYRSVWRDKTADYGGQY